MECTFVKNDPMRSINSLPLCTILFYEALESVIRANFSCHAKLSMTTFGSLHLFCVQKTLSLRLIFGVIVPTQNHITIL